MRFVIHIGSYATNEMRIATIATDREALQQFQTCGTEYAKQCTLLVYLRILTMRKGIEFLQQKRQQQQQRQKKEEKKEEKQYMTVNGHRIPDLRYLRLLFLRHQCTGPLGFVIFVRILFGLIERQC